MSQSRDKWPPRNGSSRDTSVDSYLTMLDRQFFFNLPKLRPGQGHGDLEIKCDTQRPQDVSTHQIWDSFLKYYRCVIIELRPGVSAQEKVCNTQRPQDVSTQQIWDSLSYVK